MAAEIDPTIARALSLAPPQGVNPISFSSLVPLDYDFAEILRRNLATRQIRAAVLPKNGWSDLKAVPGTFAKETAGAGIAVAPLSNPNALDVVIAWVSQDSGELLFRIGAAMSSEGDIAGWTAPVRVPVPPIQGCAGAGVAVADLGNTGVLDIVLFWTEKTDKEALGKYVVGSCLGADGTVQRWSETREVPGWFGVELQGADIALVDIGASGGVDLVVYHVTRIEGQTIAHYRIGWSLNREGDVAGDWSDLIRLPSAPIGPAQGAGIAVADIAGKGARDFLFYFVENHATWNQGKYLIGWDVNASGNVARWSNLTPAGGWLGWETQGAGVALARVSDDNRLDLVIAHLDNPSRGNHAYYQIGWNIDVNGHVRSLGQPTSLRDGLLDPLAAQWETFSPPLMDGSWRYASEQVQCVKSVGTGSGEAVITEATVGRHYASWGTPEWVYCPTLGLGAQIVCREGIGANTRKIAVEASVEDLIAGGDVGLVFNWGSSDHYWLLCVRSLPVRPAEGLVVRVPVTASGGAHPAPEAYSYADYLQISGSPKPPQNLRYLSLICVDHGTPTEQVAPAAITAEIGERIKISLERNGQTLMGRLLTDADEDMASLSFELPSGTPFGGRVGLHGRYARPAFTNMVLIEGTGDGAQTRRLIPLAVHANSEGAEGEEARSGAFEVKVIDNRPRIWADILQRLVLEKQELADVRFGQARTAYQALFAAGGAHSTQELESAEALYRRAFERRLQAQHELDEFLAHIRAEGVSVRGTLEETILRLRSMGQSSADVVNNYLEKVAKAGLPLDMRTYRYVDGQYVDQYGVALQEHVIHITENLDYETEYALLIPMIDSPRDLSEPSRTILVTNPVFSGKRVHPPSVFFEEKYQLAVEWTGIGLGEFAHSISLFPGEQREIEVTATRKRAWETVSKTSQIIKEGETREAASSSKRNDSFDSKLQDAFENSSAFENSRASSTSYKIGASASGKFGGVNASRQGSLTVSAKSSLSAVSKRARELATCAASEVAENNKVNFSTSSEYQASVEQRETGEDIETEKTLVKISNINEGRTVNYNFYQVTNNYVTTLSVENLRVHVSTGIETIVGTGLSIARSYDIDSFDTLLHDLRVFSVQDREEIVKAITGHILRHYIRVDKVDPAEADEPRVVSSPQFGSKAVDRLVARARNLYFDPAQFAGAVTGTFVQPFPDEFLRLAQSKLLVEPLRVGERQPFALNSGKFHVDAHVGIMPATEEYLEQRRAIETKRQEALVADLQERTRQGVFQPVLPGTLTTLTGPVTLTTPAKQQPLEAS